MAAIVSLVELQGGRPHPASLEVLGQARRLGSSLGASVYALALCAEDPGFTEDELGAWLSAHGADKILLGVAASHAGPLRWGSHGAAVLAACAVMQPNLVLLAATPGGRDLAARVAARLGAALVGDAWVEAQNDELVVYEGSGEGARKLSSEIDFIIVGMIPAGRYVEATGDEEAETVVLDLPATTAPDFVELAEVDPAPRAIVVGSGPAATALARALDGALVDAPDAPTRAPLCVSLDDACPGSLADVHVSLGVARAGANFTVKGDAQELARQLARALRGEGAA